MQKIQSRIHLCKIDVFPQTTFNQAHYHTILIIKFSAATSTQSSSVTFIFSCTTIGLHHTATMAALFSVFGQGIIGPDLVGSIEF